MTQADDIYALSPDELSEAVAVEALGWSKVHDAGIYRNARGKVCNTPRFAIDPAAADELWESERKAGRGWAVSSLPHADGDRYMVSDPWDRPDDVHTGPDRKIALCRAVLARARSEA